MDESLDYEKIIAQVDSAPGPSDEASVSIDISTAFEDEIETRELKYGDVSAMIEGVRTEAPPEARPRPEAQVQAPAPKHEVSNEMEVSAVKLRAATKGAGKEYEKAVAKEIERDKKAKLVMPTLSTQDQLLDLEKIDEGLGEDAFDKEQVKIIVQEVGALSRIVALQKNVELGDEDKELALMRDQKVKEIKVRLHMR